MKIPSPFGEEKSIKKKYATNNIRAHRRNRISPLPPPPHSSPYPALQRSGRCPALLFWIVLIIVVAFYNWFSFNWVLLFLLLWLMHHRMLLLMDSLLERRLLIKVCCSRMVRMKLQKMMFHNLNLLNNNL